MVTIIIRGKTISPDDETQRQDSINHRRRYGGIGRATARLFAREGANVVITGRTEKPLNDTSLELGNEGLEISHFAADVSNENDCKIAVDLTISKYCRIDILFNNAGVCYKSSTHETATSMWDETFDINVKGVFLMSKHALPHMIR